MTPLEKHFEGITPEKLKEFREDPTLFVTYASSTSKNGFLELGLTGSGNYATRLSRKDTLVHKTPLQAVEHYKSLLTQEVK